MIRRAVVLVGMLVVRRNSTDVLVEDCTYSNTVDVLVDVLADMLLSCVFLLTVDSIPVFTVWWCLLAGERLYSSALETLVEAPVDMLVDDCYSL